MLKEPCPPASQVLAIVKEVVPLKEPTFTPEKCALLVLDLQETFTSPSSHAFVPSAPQVVERVNELARVFVKKGLPVLYTLHLEANPAAEKWWRRPIRQDRLDSNLEVLGPVIVKGTYNPFLGTDLNERLKGIEGLIITGVMTHICVLSAAFEAFSRGFGVLVPVDAVASYNPRLHLSALLAMAHACASLSSTEEVVKWLG